MYVIEIIFCFRILMFNLFMERLMQNLIRLGYENCDIAYQIQDCIY